MPVAAISLLEVVQLLLLFIVVNGLIMVPVIVALIGAWNERLENQRNR